MAKSKNTLKWQFDISTYRLLGRELITDRITALFELVKNSYDANAENVYVEFHNVNPIGKDSKIVIRDDGIGMTLEDVKHKWMVIGSNSKRTKTHSSEPYNRRFVGKKGVGRFAVDKLGAKLVMTTKTKKSLRQVELTIDWYQYELKSQQLDLFSEPITGNYFTDVENEYKIRSVKDETHGTTLELSRIRDIWTASDIERVEKELAKIIHPSQKLNYPFNIFIIVDSGEAKQLESKAIEYATETRFLKANIETKIQEKLKFIEGKLITIEAEIDEDIGPVQLELYYFDRNGKAQFSKNYKGERLDGIKIYRDGLITTPFAEMATDRDNKRDILGIDKRRWSGFFDKVSSRDLLGFVNISYADNPNIEEATNRQDFIDNEGYRKLKKFIIDQIKQLEKYLSYKRKKDRVKFQQDFQQATEALDEVNRVLEKLEQSVDDEEVQSEINNLKKKTSSARKSISKGARDYEKVKKEKIRQENLFLSLMSLQDYALELAHIIRTALSRIIRLAEFFNDEFPNPDYDEYFKLYAKEIYEEMMKLDKAVDFMLSYAQSNSDFKEINIKILIEHLFEHIYKSIFEEEGIHTIVEINEPLIIVHNQKFFEDIIENLISNSRKALKQISNKVIKCTGFVEKEQFVLYFSDNGHGIADNIKEEIFDIYFTTTPEQGGAGIGLFTVQKRIEALKGSIKVVENELKPTGATFKITLPFNQR